MECNHSAKRKRASSTQSSARRFRQRHVITTESIETTLSSMAVTDSDMALAFAVVKSLPSNHDIDSFVRSLRQNINVGRSSLSRNLRYVDSPQFWKNQYESLHERTQMLEQQVLQFEAFNNIDELCETVTKLHEDLKHANDPIQRESLNTVENALREILAGRHAKSNHCTTLSLLRLSKNLFDLIQDPQVAAPVLSNAISHILRYTRFVFDRLQTQPHLDIDISTHQGFLLIARIYNLTLKALKHLCRDIHGRTLSVRIVSEILRGFANLLSAVKEICLVVARSNPLGVNNAECRRFLFENTSSPLLFPYCKERLTHLIALTQLILRIFMCEEMDSRNTQVVEVFQGMLAMVLDRVGGLVSEDIFQEHLPSSDRPAHISIVSAENTSTPRFSQAVKLEGELLAWIISQMHRERSNEHCLLTTMLVGSSSIERQTLARKAKKIVHDSLMQGIFGCDSNEFPETLVVPECSLDEEIGSPIVDDLGRPIESFIISLWESVGWSLLRHKETSYENGS